MNIHCTLLAAATVLATAFTAMAEPEHPRPVEARIEHLENAAKHLAEAGMMDESTRLRVQAAALRRHTQRDELAELQGMIEALQQENRMLHQRIEQLEAEARARTAEHKTQPSPDLDQLAAEAHRKQTEENWAAIKRAARGPRPLPAAPPDQPLPLEAPQLLPPVSGPFESRGIHPDEHALLNNILQTLQRIERNMKE